MANISEPRPLTAIFWMLVTGVCFIAVTALVKFTGPRMPPAEMAFLRYALGLVFLLPALLSLPSANLTARQWKLFAGRGILHGFGVILWFYAMVRIPIADVTAMNYLAPVYVTIGAAIFLGERLAFRRIAAVVMALLGAAVILRPGVREITDGHLGMLVAAVVFAGSYLIAKVVADEAKASVVVTLLSVFVTLTLLPFALMDWVPPTWEDLGLLLMVAFFATAGHYTMTLAFAAAPVTVTQPVTFTQLIWAVLLGYLVFDEAVDVWVLVGGGIILASVTFITWREAKLNRAGTTPVSNATKV